VRLPNVRFRGQSGHRYDRLIGCTSGGIKKLTEQIHAYVDQLAKALELAGVAIIVGGLSSQVGGLSAMGAAQVTGNLLILIIVRILDAVSYLGSSCSWAQTLSPRLPPRLRS
jgi:hypothetical protein